MTHPVLMVQPKGQLVALMARENRIKRERKGIGGKKYLQNVPCSDGIIIVAHKHDAAAL